jgi:hypothetical protein
MAYRILIEPAAARRLRTFSPYVVQGLGRQLAELLEPNVPGQAGLAGDGPVNIDAPGVIVSCRMDVRDETLTVLDVEEREGPLVSARGSAAP